MNRHRYKLQQEIEERFSKKFILTKAIEDIQSDDDCVKEINKGIKSLTSWLNQEHEVSKELRIFAIRDLDLPLLVSQITAMIALECQYPMKLVNIAAMLAKFLNMSDKLEAIQTMAEVIAVVADKCNLYTLTQTNRDGWFVQSDITLSEEVTRFAFNAFYLPPMIMKPRTVKHNRDSGYITQRGESLILGFYENHHGDNICLDVINTLSKTEYELDIDLLCSVELQRNTEVLSDDEYDELSQQRKDIYDMSEDVWQAHKTESYEIYTLLYYYGNSVYMTHKYDKRGRIYAQGYHCNTQGDSFHKALINLKTKEIVNGLGTW